MEYHFGLIALGALVGTLGTLIGAGGGFILMPVLLLIYPQARPDTVAAISLAVVWANATSGSVAYARMKRIDYRSGLLFASATIPGAILGAYSTDFIPRHIFDGVFGVILLLVAGYLLRQRDAEVRLRVPEGRWKVTRALTEGSGETHQFSFDLKLGMGLSVLVGYLSSMLGIGGGIIHVPALVRLLNFPVHLATATSHFILAIMALAGTMVHVARGSFSVDGAWITGYLGIGVLVGAQLGARLSSRVRGVWIIRSLATALGLVGIRILLLALHP